MPIVIMSLMAVVVTVLFTVFATDALTVIPPASIYQNKIPRIYEMVRNLTERVESLDKRPNIAARVRNLTERMEALDRSPKIDEKVRTLTERIEALDRRPNIDEKIRNLTEKIEALDRRPNVDEKIRNLTEKIEALGRRSNTDEIVRNMSERMEGLDRRLRRQTDQLQKQNKNANGLTEELKTTVKNLQKALLCPSDFIRSEDSKFCFKIMNERVSSTADKRKRCSALVDGGRLVELDTKEKLALVQNRIKDAPVDNYAIGGVTRVWKWKNGTPIERRWFCPGEPNNSGHTLSLFGGRNYCLDDIDDGHSRFICEKPM